MDRATYVCVCIVGVQVHYRSTGEHRGRERGEPGSRRMEVAGEEVLLGRRARSCCEFPGRAGILEVGAEVGGFPG